MKLLVAVLLWGAMPALAQTTVDGDLWVQGKAGIGTSSPGARLEVKASSSAQVSLQVSGVDESPLFQVAKDGRVGLSTAPAAQLDINGVGDAGDIGLSLGNGNLYPSSATLQLLFGYAGQAINRHGLRSVHAPTVENNRLDLLLWNPAAGSSSALPTLRVLSLETSTKAAGGGAFHVLPVGRAEVELAVSNGSSYGGGTILRAAEATHSSRALKTDIRDLEPAEIERAPREATSLRHVRFRYKGGPGPMRRGLIYEEASESVRGPGKTVSVDARVLNAELAAQELARELEALDAELDGLGARP